MQRLVSLHLLNEMRFSFISKKVILLGEKVTKERTNTLEMS
jgi:hypothetical protein